MSPTDIRLTSPLHWRQLDGQWVVYQSRTGHMAPLDAVSAAVASLLEDGPASMEDLVQRVAEHTELPADAELSGAVLTVLGVLSRAGLVVCDEDGLAW